MTASLQISGLDSKTSRLRPPKHASLVVVDANDLKFSTRKKPDGFRPDDAGSSRNDRSGHVFARLQSIRLLRLNIHLLPQAALPVRCRIERFDDTILHLVSHVVVHRQPEQPRTEVVCDRQALIAAELSAHGRRMQRHIMKDGVNATRLQVRQHLIAEFVDAVEKLSINSRRQTQPASVKSRMALSLITFGLFPKPQFLPTNTTGRFLGSYVNTISRVFPNVYLFSSKTIVPHDERDTFVIVASKKHLDLSDLSQNSGHWQGAPFASLETDSKGKLIASGQMNEVLANAHGIVLTDDFAPVDNLLSTVFDAR